MRRDKASNGTVVTGTWSLYLVVLLVRLLNMIDINVLEHGEQEIHYFRPNSRFPGRPLIPK